MASRRGGGSLTVGLLSLCLAACGTARVASRAPTRVAAASGDLLPSETAALSAAGLDRAALECSSRNRWSTALRPRADLTADQILGELARLGAQVPDGSRHELDRRIKDAVFWGLVLTELVDGDQNNLGAAAVTLRGHRGQPVAVLRTGFTARPDQPGSCVHSMVRAGVRHIVNLYAGPMPTVDLAAAESRTVRAVGGTYYDARHDTHTAHFREDLRAGDGPEEKRAAMEAVAHVIRAEILRPGGQPPRGHVQVHCGGGMHRTGMVVGVLERCIGGRSMPDIEERFKRHVGWRSASEPGGFEPDNLAFIAGFDCGLLSDRQ